MWRTGVVTGSVIDSSNGLNYLANPQYQFGDMWSIKYDAMNIGLPAVVVTQPEPTPSDQAAVEAAVHKAEPAVENAAARVEAAVQKAAEKAAEKASTYRCSIRQEVASPQSSVEQIGPWRELRLISLLGQPH